MQRDRTASKFLKLLASLSLMTAISLSCSANSLVRSGAGESDPRFPGWRTNTAKHSVDLDEIVGGGPPKDGIPAINQPWFESVANARQWLRDNEPVIALELGGKARAYPLQILVWHEIVNDEIEGVPVAVSFCPLCYSALAFDRRLDDQTLLFGVSGLLRHSDMVMYDRQTESWWQQFTGEAIVGDLTGKRLRQLPAQIVGFAQFAAAHSEGLVLSRNTGYLRDYGRNPYVGYDSISASPILYRGKTDSRLRPMEKVVAIQLGDKAKAYPYSITRSRHVIADRVGSTDLVVFHAEGAASALESGRINESRDVGATGVFDPKVDDQYLHFNYAAGEFVDDETGSRWNILGQAISGPLRGKRLKPIVHGDYFAFAWLAFQTETEIFRD